MPALFLLRYAPDNCGGLDSLGAGIIGWLLGLAVFAATVVGATVALQRAHLLLVVPPVLLLHYALAVENPQWPPTLSLCNDPVSALVPALLAALAGVLTYALAPRVLSAN